VPRVGRGRSDGHGLMRLYGSRIVSWEWLLHGRMVWCSGSYLGVARDTMNEPSKTIRAVHNFSPITTRLYNITTFPPRGALATGSGPQPLFQPHLISDPSPGLPPRPPAIKHLVDLSVGTFEHEDTGYNSAAGPECRRRGERMPLKCF